MESTGIFIDNVMIIMRIQTICTTEIVESLTIDLKLGIDRHFKGIQMRYRFEGNKIKSVITIIVTQFKHEYGLKSGIRVPANGA